MIRVAVVDTGVSKGILSDVNDLEYNVEIRYDSSIDEYTQNNEIMTHGTICAGIIKKYAPYVIISNIRIMYNGEANLSQLLAALSFCRKQRFNVINLSGGFLHPHSQPSLRDIVEQLSVEGIILVAAGRDDGLISYPSKFNATLGVTHLLNATIDCQDYVWSPNTFSGVDIMANGKHKLLMKNGQDIITDNESSYATPFVSAMVCDYIVQYNGPISLMKIKLLFEKGAKHIEA